MDTAHVHLTECFQNKTAWTQATSENQMHAYWFNINTNNQDIGKTKVKIEISCGDSDTAPHLSCLPPHD